MNEQIQNYLRAGFSALYIVSVEEARVENEVRAAAENLEYGLYAWSITSGTASASDGSAHGGGDPIDQALLLWLYEYIHRPSQSWAAAKAASSGTHSA